MLGRTNVGGGSNELALRVIGSPTQPSNPKYPTIWVQTSVPIANYEMGLTDAPNWDMGTGFVYLTTQMSAFDDAVVINPFRKNWLFVKSYMCWQQIGGTADAPQWQQMNAWLYAANNEWVQIATSFAATINVTYPAGSTCTATNGTYTLTAPDTSGTWACIVPATGTWTVSCTDGSKNATNTVNIATNGQTTNLRLVYELYLLQNGVQKVAFSQNAYSGTVTFGNSAITMDGDTTNVWTTSTIDISAYSRLKVTYSGGYDMAFGVRASAPSGVWSKPELARIDVSTANSVTTVQVDISAINQNVYVHIYSHLTTAYIYSIWLE